MLAEKAGPTKGTAQTETERGDQEEGPRPDHACLSPSVLCLGPWQAADTPFCSPGTQPAADGRAGLRRLASPGAYLAHTCEKQPLIWRDQLSTVPRTRFTIASSEHSGSEEVLQSLGDTETSTRSEEVGSSFAYTRVLSNTFLAAARPAGCGAGLWEAAHSVLDGQSTSKSFLTHSLILPL